MPKGGDLHVHLSGAVYAERFIAWAAQDGLCANWSDVMQAGTHCDQPGDVLISQALRDQQFYDRLVNAFSTRAYLPSVHVPTEHDAFFATFARFGAASGSHFADMMIDQLRQYHEDNVQYVEFMISFSCPNEKDRFIAAVGAQSGDAAKLAALEAGGLAECVASQRRDLETASAKIRSELACDPQNAAGLPRNLPLHRAGPAQQSSRRRVFSDRPCRTMIRAEPLVVALNLVQAEDDLVARRDYTRHMQIVAFLASDVPVALHAGELWLGLVPPPDLTFHIRQAIEIGGARRIGHGVSFPFEHDAQSLLAEMRRWQITVEINLTSNDKILGVRGKDHPLPAYLAAGVPVVLSTDDPGVSRINLANEYFRAARDYGLDYRALKAIARNALIRAFLDDAQRRSELERFDQSSAEFERSMAGTRSRQENLAALIRAALVPAL
jgi:adenosine deaminase